MDRYKKLLAAGKEYYENNLFNGEYFFQEIKFTGLKAGNLLMLQKHHIAGNILMKQKNYWNRKARNINMEKDVYQMGY